MKIKKIVAMALTFIMLMGIAPIGAINLATKASAKDISSYSVGDIITYGSYPQSKVTDSATISALDAKSKSWVSYGYYSGTGNSTDGNMKPSDYMKYCDISYNGNKYRAVTFSSYRPYYTGYTSSNTYQDDNGYYTGNVYYFRYDPLTWRVLDPSEGFVMCNTAIDAQAYNNYILYYNNGNITSYDVHYGNSAKTYYASDWANSSIRAWLNNDFYNTAFTSTEKSQIGTTYNENKSIYSSEYDSANTNDKIFLLSYNEVLNTKYGFSSSTSSSTTRQLKSTDYAKCQGCWQSTSTSYLGNSSWRLRSPYYSGYAAYVSSGGRAYSSDPVNYSYSGVVPAFKFNPKSTIQNLNYTQTHTVSGYATKNAEYAKTYLSNAGTALDGKNSTQNMIIPGLKNGENMVPQGIAYYANKNQMLITSYDSTGKHASMIFALDYTTGDLVAEYEIIAGGSALKGHVGGIGVSGNNIYIANGKHIYYIPAENLSNGKAVVKATMGVAGYFNEMSGEASCSYLSVIEDTIWLGNFYDDTNPEYKKPANSAYNSVVMGFALTGSGDNSEWEALNSMSAPSVVYKLQNKKIENIQGATVINKKLIMTASLGKGNNSTVYIADTSKLTDNVVKESNVTALTGLPMMEGICVKDGYMYSINESGAYKYINDKKSKNPTDVVWCYSLNKLTGVDMTSYTTGDVENKNVSFVIDGAKGNTDVNFKQSWFSVDSSNYNHNLGQLCSQYAMIGYDDGQKPNLKKALEAIGMSNIEIQPTAAKEEVNYFIANRKITANGKQYTLVFAGFIGSYHDQWYSNFDPGTGSTHKGFTNAKNYVMGKLNTYINSLGVSKDSVKILITGHSRGAATANLVAADLIKNQQFAYRENIYTYAFATPNSTTLPERNNPEYKRIFNVVNPEDFVTKVMLVGWGYGRYGTSFVLPSRTNSSEYINYLTNMSRYFKNFTGATYHPYETGEAYTYLAVSQLYLAVPTVQGFYNSPLMAGYTPMKPYDFFQNTLCRFVAKTATTAQMVTAGAIAAETLTAICSSAAYRSILTYFIHGGNGVVTDQFIDAHRAETYCAYMMSMSAKDMKYRDGFLNAVNCPVDVDVYEKNTGELVGRIRNNVVDETVAAKDNAIVMYVDGESKQFWLPSDGEYDVKLTGNDSGKMDYTVADIDSDAGEIQRTNFYDVNLTNGLKMTGEVEGMDDFVLEEYKLNYENGSERNADEIIGDDKQNTVAITTSTAGEGSGIVTDSMNVTKGDYVTLTAEAEEGSTFKGWYIGSNKVSDESEYSFVAKENVSISAKFEKAAVVNPELKLPTESVTVKVGESVTVKPDCVKPEGMTTTYGFASGNKDVATAVADNGIVITGVSAGTTKVRVRLIDKNTGDVLDEKYISVTVNSNVMLYTEYALPDRIQYYRSGYESQGYRLRVMSYDGVDYSYCNEDDYTVKYSSSNPSVATIDDEGMITTYRRGNTTITYTVKDKYGNEVKESRDVTVYFSFGQWLIWILLFGFLWY